jgi:co-chaperonin GroES (HSP10)
VSRKLFKKLLNGNILVRIKKTTNEYTTASGIYISGVEQDFLTAEVVQVPDEPVFFDKDDNLNSVEIHAGDFVVLERNFHNKYNIAERHRIDHTILVKYDDEYNYYITNISDVLLVSTNDDDNGIEFNTLVIGELYSIMHQLAGTSIKRK